MESYWDKLAYSRLDLSACADEPIQYCGATQSWGFFLSCDPDSGLILAASENWAELIGSPVASLLGQSVETFLTYGDGQPLDFRKAVEDSRSQNLHLRAKNTAIDISGQFASGQTLVLGDFEYDLHLPAPDPIRFVEHLRKLVFHVDLEADAVRMLSQAASQIRELTQFDRVMIYRFEPNHDGCVIAEAAAGHLDSYHGLWYPAADIPAQSRALYLNSKYRMIVDTHAEPIPIATRRGLGRSEVDLSDSALRAVSPFHIQYLKNMGVRSSFSIPLKVNGKLWGLIACHHYSSPLHLSRELRSSCELAGQVLSGRLADQLNDRRLRTRNQILSLSQSLLGRVTEGQTPIEAFKEIEAELLDMTQSTGVFVRFGGEVATFGVTPSFSYVDQVIGKLKLLDSLSLWASDSVARDLQLPPDQAAIGAMAVPFSFAFDDLIVWFRPESVREVQWGGDPRGKGHDQDILSPRASFKAWSEVIKGRSREWNETAQEAAQHLLFMFVRGIFQKASELSRANHELQRLTQAKDEFIGMISHELRTPLGVMIGWIDILRDEGSHDPRMNQALEIIERNAKLQVNLINDLLDVSRIIAGKMRLNPQEHVSIGGVIQDVVKDLSHSAMAKRIVVTVQVQEDVVAPINPDRMRQIIWNLLSNAIKFTPKETGRIEVYLERVDSTYQISVRDNGAGIERSQLKRIFERFAQSNEGHAALGGLGLGLSIVKALVELHGGQITARSDGRDNGATFVASFPMFNLKAAPPEVTVPSENPTTAHGELNGVRILLAEDQADAGLALDYYLRKAGATTTLVKDGGAALNAVSEHKFDVLLSDIGMPVLDGVELIKRIRKLESERQSEVLPAVALTAYATPKDRVRCLQAGFQNHIAKPVDRDELLAVIRSVLPTLREKGN